MPVPIADYCWQKNALNFKTSVMNREVIHSSECSRYSYHKMRIIRSRFEACQSLKNKCSASFWFFDEKCLIYYLLSTQNSWPEKTKQNKKLGFFHLFMILLSLLWYEYFVPWTRNREKICTLQSVCVLLHAFCHPYDNQNHFLRNQQVIVDKISWNNRSFLYKPIR